MSDLSRVQVKFRPDQELGTQANKLSKAHGANTTIATCAQCGLDVGAVSMGWLDRYRCVTEG